MRWKLIIITPIVASIVGAGGALALLLGLMGSTAKRLAALDLYVLLILLIPILAILFASLFVYRHTARRRKLQAFLTALLSMLLVLTIPFAASIIIAPPLEEQGPPAPPTRNTA